MQSKQYCRVQGDDDKIVVEQDVYELKVTVIFLFLVDIVEQFDEIYLKKMSKSVNL